MENKTASCPSDHLLRRGRRADMRKRSQYFERTANHSRACRTPPRYPPLRHLNLIEISTPHRLQDHPCERHGMAVVSYSVLAFSPCATAKKPASRCHASLLRTTVDLRYDFFMLELLLYHALRHWSCWGKYMHCKAVSCPSTTCDLLRVSVGELRETSHSSICRSVGGNTAPVRRLPGQPDACIPGNTHSCHFLLCIVHISNVHP